VSLDEGTRPVGAADAPQAGRPAIWQCIINAPSPCSLGLDYGLLGRVWASCNPPAYTSTASIGSLNATRAAASDPPLPDLEYCFLARQDDSRDLVRRIKRYVIEEVDLSRDTNPFRDL
jgi:hypothetical protein